MRIIAAMISMSGHCPNRFVAFFASLAVLFHFGAIQSPAGAQTLLTVSHPTDGSFRSVGVSSNGTVVVLGSTDGGNPVIYEFAGTNVHEIQPDHFAEIEDASEVCMSRDGEYFASEFHGDNDLRGINLWSRSAPETLLLITNVGVSISSPVDVISLTDGPMILAQGNFAPMLWQHSTGWRSTVSNNISNSVIVLHKGSEDGKQFVATHFLPDNQFKPMRIKDGKVRYLSEGRTDNGVAFISPNGRYIGGMRNRRPAVWYSRTFFYLPAASGLYAERVTDSGFAAVNGNGEWRIYDPRTRKAYPFNVWWQKYYPSVPLPVPISRINDLYEHGGSLYCLVAGAMDELSSTYNYVAVAPLKRPRRYKL